MAMPVGRLGRSLAIAVLVGAFLLPMVATIHVRLAGPVLHDVALGVRAPTMLAQAVVEIGRASCRERV